MSLLLVPISHASYEMLLAHSTSQYADKIINGSKDIAVTTTVLVATVFVAKYVKNKVIPLLEKYWSSDEPNSPRSTANTSDQKTLSGNDVAQQSSPCSTTANSQSAVVLPSTPEHSSVGEHMQNNSNVSSNTSKSNKPEDSSIHDSEYSSQDGALNPDDAVITDDELDESDHDKLLIDSMTSQSNEQGEAPWFQPVNISGNNTHKPTTESTYSNHENDSLNNSSEQILQVKHDGIVVKVVYSIVHVPSNMLVIKSAANDFCIKYDFENEGENYTKPRILRVHGATPQEILDKLGPLEDNIHKFIKLLDTYKNSITLLKSQEQVCVTTVEQLVRLVIKNPDIFNKITLSKSDTVSLDRIKALSEYLRINHGPLKKDMEKELAGLIKYTINYPEPQNKVLCYIDFVKEISQVIKFDERTHPRVVTKIAGAYRELIVSYRVYKDTLDEYNTQIEQRNRKSCEHLAKITDDMGKGIVYYGLSTDQEIKYRELSIADRFIAQDEENTADKLSEPSSDDPDNLL